MKNFKTKLKFCCDATFAVKAISPENANQIVYKHLESIGWKIDRELKKDLFVSIRINQSAVSTDE